MQPYQEASEEIQRQRQAPKQFAKGIGKTALGIASGVAGASFYGKIAPFLSQYIPENLAIKGLSKLDPKMAGFISTSMGQGFSFGDIKQFLGNKLEKQNVQENKNIIQKYSPELFQEINDWIRKGALPMQAAAKVYNKYKDVIGKIQKDNKVDWLELVESIFGQASQGQQQGQQQTQQSQQQAQGGGSSQDQIKAALQKIMQM